MHARVMPAVLMLLPVATLAGLALPAARAAAGPGPHAASRPAASQPVTGYVANQLSGTVTAFDTATNSTLATINIAGGGPGQIVITPNGKTAYVSNGTNTVVPINTATNKPGAPIPAGTGAGFAAITPNGKTAYVADGGADTVTPINTATNKPGAPIPVEAGPGFIAITPNGKTAYVTTGGSVTPFQARSPW